MLLSLFMLLACILTAFFLLVDLCRVFQSLFMKQIQLHAMLFSSEAGYIAPDAHASGCFAPSVQHMHAAIKQPQTVQCFCTDEMAKAGLTKTPHRCPRKDTPGMMSCQMTSRVQGYRGAGT